MTCMLTQEVLNRFRALPPDQKRDVCLALMRITVEVTREFMEHCPEGVDEFLRIFPLSNVH